MSTKNLARTVIEGGRAPSNGWWRRFSNAQERSAERGVSGALVRGADADAAVYPRRKPVERAFLDRLGPAERWLAKQVGRPWSKVRSELFARFDARTTAGRHVLYGHLLRDVAGDAVGRSWGRFTVDVRGILKRNPRRY
ncbi:MAG TPA: hypothetical protein VMI54_16670 [Polyangiaceae bacterium]|nr:hypothetical protein [Polyangiaceae bacterium]